MDIFIDESGLFVPTATRGSWSAVAAYVVSDSQLAQASTALNAFKLAAGFSEADEVKRRKTSEHIYFGFLEALQTAGGFAVVVASEASINSHIVENQHGQAKLIREGGNGLTGEAQRVAWNLADSIGVLSPQLYVEIICRMLLVWQVVKLGTLLHVKTNPQALSKFSWWFDAKDNAATRFEESFGPLLVGLALHLSKQDPLPLLKGADYSHFQRFYREPPVYTGSQVKNSSGADRWLNASLLWTEHLTFVNSAHNIGIQIADLLASGFRGCIREEFEDNSRAARLLGRLTPRIYRPDNAVIAVGFGQGKSPYVSAAAASTIMQMTAASTPMFNHARNFA